MPTILNIETGTDSCSVALAKGTTILALAESNEAMSHGKQLSLLIEKVLNDAEISIQELSAVAVGEGPGSYTGLRIGVSTAKGICYGANKPLIAVSSLHALAASALKLHPSVDLLCPMIDARRMEVYTQLFNTQLQAIGEVEAKIIDEQSYTEQLETQRIAFFGNGADKCKSVVQSSNSLFIDVKESAAGMVPISFEKYQSNIFVDTAYFEPYYLKDFMVTTSKKNYFNNPLP